MDSSRVDEDGRSVGQADVGDGAASAVRSAAREVNCERALRACEQQAIHAVLAAASTAWKQHNTRTSASPGRDEPTAL